MTEIVGFVSALVTLVDVTAKVVQYVNAAKNAPKETVELATEAANNLHLLFRLKQRIEDSGTSQNWKFTVDETVRNQIVQVETALADLAKELELGSKGLKKLGNQILWPIHKGKLKDIVERVQRLNFLVGLALDDHLVQLATAVKSDTNTIMQNTFLLRDKTDAAAEVVKRKEHIEYQLKAVSFIATHDFGSKLSDMLSARQPGTGEWFLRAPEFLDWKEKPGSMLWCPGIPGAGKTILISTAIDHLQAEHRSNNDVMVIYAFGDYKEQEVQTVPNVLASLWAQIGRVCALDKKICKQLHENYVRRSVRPNKGQMVDILRQEVTRWKQVFVLIDALDEFGAKYRAELVEALQGLGANVNLLIMSRFIVELDSPGIQHSRTLRIRAADSDLNTFIAGRIKEETRLRQHVRKDTSLGKEMADTIIKKARGMFLLARLHLETLSTKLSSNAVRKALKSLPEGKDAVEETYSQALKRIESQNTDDKRLALRIFLWLSTSLRRLSLTELKYAVSFDVEEEIEEDCVISTEMILTACGGLVITDSSRDAVRFVHYTTQEYFMQKRTTLFPHGHAELAISCIRFLCLDQFAFPPTVEGGSKFWPWKQLVPLQVYASINWGQHARLFFTAYPDHSENQEGGAIRAELEDAIRMFIVSHDNVYHAFRIFLPWALKSEIFKPFSGENYTIFKDHKYLILFNPCGNIHVYLLSMFAYFGLDHPLDYLVSLDDSYRQESRDGFGNIVHWAVMGGHLSTVKLLLEKHNLHHLLHEGAHGGFLPMMETGHRHQLISTAKLLRFGGNSKAMINRYAVTPLHLAVYSGKLDTISFILGMMDKYNLSSLHRPNPLHIAIRSKSVNIIKVLLESKFGPYLARAPNPIAPRLPCGAPQNSLHYAIAIGNLEVVELFLNLSRRDLFEQPKSVFRTALDYAVGFPLHLKYQDIIELFVNHMSRAEALDEHAASILHRIIPETDSGFLDFILRELPGHDLLDRRFSNGDTPLHRAIQNDVRWEWGYIKAVYILHNVKDINPQDARGRTPLHKAMFCGYPSFVRLLLEKGADVNVRDYQGCTALHYIGDPDLIWALVKAGGNINGRDFKGRTPLHHIATRYTYGLVQELLEAGAQVNARDLEGTTALHLAVTNAQSSRWTQDGFWDEIIMALVGGGADTNVVNVKGETPLSVARAEGNVIAIEILEYMRAKEKSDPPLPTDVPR